MCISESLLSRAEGKLAIEGKAARLCQVENGNMLTIL